MDFIQQLGAGGYRKSNKKMKPLYSIRSLYPALGGHISVFFMMFILENKKKKCIHMEIHIFRVLLDSIFELTSVEMEVPRMTATEEWHK